jgi:hypothetical protein
MELDEWESAQARSRARLPEKHSKKMGIPILSDWHSPGKEASQWFQA